jgi:hypothetical protein
MAIQVHCSLFSKRRPFPRIFLRGDGVAAIILEKTFDSSAAERVCDFQLNFRTSWLGLSVVVLFVLTLLIGCGATSNGNFSGSPSSGGSGGGGTGSSPATASSVTAVTVPSTSIAAGSSSLATVTLNAAAPSGGAIIAFTSSNASAASVPASVAVAAGQATGTFTITAGNVSSDTTVTITAAYNNTFAGATLTVKAPPTPPPTPVSVTISPASVSLSAGGTQQFTATVTGTTNTAVSWTAFAGTITSAGLFTAPNVSTQTLVTVFATSLAASSVVATAQVTVTPVVPPPSGGGYSGTGPVASWQAYQYRDTDGLYHQAIKIYNAQAAYPVIGYSYSDSGCTNLGDTFNDFWQPIGNGLWWFINRPDLIYVRWVWYNNATDKQILQQTPCMDYSGAPKYN